MKAEHNRPFVFDIAMHAACILSYSMIIHLPTLENCHISCNEGHFVPNDVAVVCCIDIPATLPLAALRATRSHQHWDVFCLHLWTQCDTNDVSPVHCSNIQRLSNNSIRECTTGYIEMFPIRSWQIDKQLESNYLCVACGSWPPHRHVSCELFVPHKVVTTIHYIRYCKFVQCPITQKGSRGEEEGLGAVVIILETRICRQNVFFWYITYETLKTGPCCCSAGKGQYVYVYKSNINLLLSALFYTITLLKAGTLCTNQCSRRRPESPALLGTGADVALLKCTYQDSWLTRCTFVLRTYILYSFQNEPQFTERSSNSVHFHPAPSSPLTGIAA